MDFDEGDIQFLNNRLIVHGRAEYDDYLELARRRHRLRLWLLVPNWPARPTNQKDIYSVDDLPGRAKFHTPFMEFSLKVFAGD